MGKTISATYNSHVRQFIFYSLKNLSKITTFELNSISDWGNDNSPDLDDDYPVIASWCFWIQGHKNTQQMVLFCFPHGHVYIVTVLFPAQYVSFLVQTSNYNTNYFGRWRHIDRQKTWAYCSTSRCLNPEKPLKQNVSRQMPRKTRATYWNGLRIILPKRWVKT